MGEISEMILEGILCEQCGCMIGDEPEAVGYPRKCEDCKPKKERKPKKSRAKAEGK